MGPGPNGLLLAAAVLFLGVVSELEVEHAIRHLIRLKVCHVLATTWKRKTVPRMNAGTIGIN